ncbi:hypothetical protein OAL99_05440 [Gammaproteobacteria bacterium]|nr:hypothetical protein [Gammaproteobacteria bacterium]MDP2379754.1 hypothetical protein [Pseudohongiella sp.]
MPAKKGTNRFEAFQNEKQASRELLIRDFLSYLKTSRTRHLHVTALSEFVAKHISMREGKPCNRATLLRNPRYKSMLLSHMADNFVAGTKRIAVKDIADPKAQALTLTLQVETSNLKRDNDRLRLYVAQLESAVACTDKQVLALTASTPDALQKELDQAQIRYARACQSLQLVIKHLNSVVSVDMNSRQIVDLTKRVNNVIVNSDIASGFFDWLDANRGIG